MKSSTEWLLRGVLGLVIAYVLFMAGQQSVMLILQANNRAAAAERGLAQCQEAARVGGEAPKKGSGR